jgi:DNA-binding beta-propeller fold protein YncE
LTTFDFGIRAFAFDSEFNIYVADNNSTAGTGTRDIMVFDAASSWSTSSVFVTYDSVDTFVSGIVFDSSGNLLVSEVDHGGDSGHIVEVNSSSGNVLSTIEMPDFRPTGIEVDSSDNILFSSRKSSNLLVGDIYEIAAGSGTTVVDNSDTPLISGFSSLGLALTGTGDLFGATPGTGEVVPSSLDPNSIYLLDALDPSSSELIASFDGTGARELRIGPDGVLYAIGSGGSGTSRIVGFAPVPIPATLWLFGSGLLGLFGISRRKKMT